MHKLWRWLKSKREIFFRNKNNEDANKFSDKRKWHSYIFPGRKDRRESKSIAENIDQQQVAASTSMPAICSQNGPQNAVERTSDKIGVESPKKVIKSGTKNMAPIKTTTTINIEIQLMSPKRKNKSHNELILVATHRSPVSIRKELFINGTEEKSLTFVQANEAPSHVSGGDCCEDDNQSGRSSSHTFFSISTSSTERPPSGGNDQQSPQLPLCSPVKTYNNDNNLLEAAKNSVAVSAVNDCVLPNSSKSPSLLSPPSSSAGRKGFRKQHQHQMGKCFSSSTEQLTATSVDEEDRNFDADDEFTSSFCDPQSMVDDGSSIGQIITDIKCNKDSFNNRILVEDGEKKAQFLKSSKKSPRVSRACKQLQQPQNSLEDDDEEEEQHENGNLGNKIHINLDTLAAQDTLPLVANRTFMPQSATRKLRFLIPRVSISHPDFNSVSLGDNTTEEKLDCSTVPSKVDCIEMSSGGMVSLGTSCNWARQLSAAEIPSSSNINNDKKVSNNLLCASGKATATATTSDESSRHSLTEFDKRQLSLAQRRQSNLELVHQASGRRTSTTLIPLTAAQIHLVRSLWRQVYMSKGPTVIGTTIQQRLFFKVPSLRDLFRRTPLPKGHINYDSFCKSHCKQMAEMIDKVVESLDDLQSVGPALENIGRIHARVSNGQLSSKLWNAVAETFIDCTLTWGDRRARSETVRKAWALIVAYIIERIKHGHLEERKQIAAMNTTMSSFERISTKEKADFFAGRITISPVPTSRSVKDERQIHKKVKSLEIMARIPGETLEKASKSRSKRSSAKERINHSQQTIV